MAPIKFEENIKDKLERRTLSPSSNAWSKLSDRLDEDEKKSKKPLYWWISIAAGLILMMAISIQFFNNNNSEEILPQIVEEEVKKEELKTEKAEPIKKALELVTQENIVEEEKIAVSNNEAPKILDYKKVINDKTKKNIKLANKDNVKEPNTQPNNNNQSNIEQQNIIEKTLIKEALAVAKQGLKDEQSGVSEREIDSLLKLASKELFKENLQKETYKLTDAEALLNSVEEEMGQSFRTKVFEALKDSYKTVKTAVVDRNN
ncbi:hypothetical protein HNV10_00330 [Winogradskyella litoriviva]|uniref:Anti-sigma factor n=1 Tax=Winogradskyella litoriviva TaxID=1220182 RepID=A0ABX2E0Z9_9FLAO|nr:hypothetical protein [Winogradskyella litoriviva]NRD21666.1 hypothetical protein [Winogradskyella litoriviva]